MTGKREKGRGGEVGRRPIKVPLLNIDQLVICDEGRLVRNVLSCAKKTASCSLEDVREEGKTLRVAQSHELFWL